MPATMSILGLYNWDPTIFNTMTIPTGIDKPTVVDNILLECAELETIFPDPGFMKTAIKKWSAMMLPTWQRIKDAVSVEYNPLENYDRTETEGIAENTSRSNSRTTGGSTTNSGQDRITDSGTDTNKVAAYDASTLVAGSAIDYGRQQTTNHGLTQTLTGSETGSETDNHSVNRSTRVHGNIGVTTSQQMLQAEIDIAVPTNLIMRIVDDFKKRFCILVY